MKIKGFLHLEIYYVEIYNINGLFVDLRKHGGSRVLQQINKYKIIKY